MQIEELARLIDAEISAGGIAADIEAIQALDRHFTFPKFLESARLVVRKLSECGLEGSLLEQPADGVTRMGDWTMPLAWDCREAVLELVEPAAAKGRVLARRSQDPNSLAMWSAPTQGDGVVAEIVGPLRLDPAGDGAGRPSLVLEGGRPRPVQDGELSGKIAFSSQNPRNLKAALLRAGCVGMVSSFMPKGQDLPENRSWVNGWADDPGAWAFTARDTPMWCFMLTPRQGCELAELLAAGPVRARATVDSRIYEGVLPAATGLLRGTSHEEILVLGHQFEIGADDNASGCAAMLEAARVLAALVARGALPRPRRSIRFLFMSECYGSLAYAVGDPETARHTLVAMNLDCVGGDQRKVDMPLPVSLTPCANPSVADTVILGLLRGFLSERDPFFAWRTTDFSPCDSTIGDPLIGIPTVYLGGKDRFWHTTADTIDKIDPQACSRVAVLAAAFAYYLAAAGSEEAEFLAEEASAQARRELARQSAARAAVLHRTAGTARGEALWAATEAIDHLEGIGLARTRSALRFSALDERREFRVVLRNICAQIKKQADLERRYLHKLAARLADDAGEAHPRPTAPRRPVWWAEAEKLVPVRLVPGTVTLEGIDDKSIAGIGQLRWSTWLTNVLFRCDGQRTLAEAVRLGTLDSGGQDRPERDPVAIFQVLERHNRVELRTAHRVRRLRAAAE